jgi:type III pantothenate kinase
LIKFNLLKLVIDFGNSQVKLALFCNKDLVATKKIKFFSRKEVIGFCGDITISSSIYSKVRKLTASEQKLISSLNCVELNKDTPLPISSMYESYVGSDRIAAVVGATFLFPNKDIWVFDAGSCLTADFIDKEKKYHGGRITLGLKMRYKALNDYTSDLPLINQQEHTPFKGENTKNSIVSGVQRGILSEVKTLMSEWKKENKNFIVLFTGGDLSFFEKELKSSIFADPFLVLKGLNEILDYNE